MGMDCAECGEPIIIDRIVVYDVRTSEVVNVTPYDHPLRSSEERKVRKELGLEPEERLMLGEPYIEDQGKFYHERCYHHAG